MERGCREMFDNIYRVYHPADYDGPDEVANCCNTITSRSFATFAARSGNDRDCPPGGEGRTGPFKLNVPLSRRLCARTWWARFATKTPWRPAAVAAAAANNSCTWPSAVWPAVVGYAKPVARSGWFWSAYPLTAVAVGGTFDYLRQKISVLTSSTTVRPHQREHHNNSRAG